jgi:hypothetical protein
MCLTVGRRELFYADSHMYTRFFMDFFPVDRNFQGFAIKSPK